MDKTKLKQLKLKPEDEAKAKERAAQRDAAPKVDEFNILVAEFGMYYGYDAVQAVLNDEIELSTVVWLIQAAHKVDARNQYNLSAAVFTAVAAANSKKPSQDFKKYTSHYLRAAKADA